MVQRVEERISSCTIHPEHRSASDKKNHFHHCLSSEGIFNRISYIEELPRENPTEHPIHLGYCFLLIKEIVKIELFFRVFLVDVREIERVCS